MLVYSRQPRNIVKERTATVVVRGAVIESSLEEAQRAPETSTCLVKVLRESSYMVDPYVFREIAYSSYLSRHTYDVDARQNVATDTFTGVPRCLAVCIDKGRRSVCVATQAMSLFSLDRIVKNLYLVPCRGVMEAWLMQGLHLLATMEVKGILNRDIKCEHLLIDSSGSLALIDWGLSTRHADNTYLTEYVVTYPYRPLEIFMYCGEWLNDDYATPPSESNPLYVPQGVDASTWSIVTKHIEEPDTVSSFTLKPRSRQQIVPYSCESDMYGFGLSFLLSLVKRQPFAIDTDLPFFYKQKFHVKQMFEWHGMWDGLVRAYKLIETKGLVAAQRESVASNGTCSFAFNLASHWHECFSKRRTTILCPFSSWSEACDRAPVKSLSERVASLKEIVEPTIGAQDFLDQFGPLLLTMCHLDPDERPKACSLLHGLARSKTLLDWQRVSLDWMERLPVGLKRLMFPFVDARDVINPHSSGAIVCVPLVKEWGDEWKSYQSFCEHNEKMLADIANDCNVMSADSFRATWPELSVDKIKAYIYHCAQNWVQ